MSLKPIPDLSSLTGDSALLQFLSRIDDPVVALDETLQVTFLNAAAENALGVALEASEDRRFDDVVPFASESDRDRLESVLDTGQTVEFDLYDDQRERSLLVTGYPSTSGVVTMFEDVTERKADTRELERFREALDQSNDAILVIDPDRSRILDVNETACERLGYSRAELRTRSPTDIETTISDAAEWRDHVRELREEGSLTFEGRHQRKDGTTFPVEVDLSLATAENGNEILVAVARDVTDRHARIRELKRLQQAVEHAGHAIYITDTDGTIEYVNPAFEETTGYTAPETVGRNPRILQSGRQDESYYETLWETIRNGEVFHEEVPNRRKNGELYWADQIIAPIVEDGDPTAYVAIQRDITERKEHDRELELLHTLVDSANDAVYVFDQGSGEVEYANSTAAEMLGYEKSAFAEMTIADISHHFETVADFHDLIGQDEWPSALRIETEHSRADGTRFPVEVSARSVDIDGTIHRVAIARDITDRKARIRALEAYQQSLERINEATVELLGADSRDDLRAPILDVTADIFAESIVAYYGFERETTTLELEELRGEDFPDDETAPTLKPGESVLWEAFADGSVREVTDMDGAWMPTNGSGDWLLIPIEGEAMIAVARETGDDFRDRALELAKLVSTISDDGFERLAWKSELRSKRDELEVTNERLAELTRVNEHVRKLQTELLQANTREEVEGAVCQSLNELEETELVWIGGYRPGQQSIEPRSWAGRGTNYLDASEFDVSEEGADPAVRAIAERGPVGIRSIADRMDGGDWYRSALKRGFGSALSVPITHDDVLYGVLTMYESSPMSFIEQREVVFAELGETIARAITMLEQRRSLGSEDRVELEFETEHVETLCAVLVQRLDVPITIDGVVDKHDDSYLLYGETDDVSESDIETAVAEIPSITHLRILESGATRVRFELETDQEIPPVTIIESGGRFHRVRVTTDNCRLVASYHDTAQINTVIETFTTRHPSWQLRARRRRKPEERTGGTGRVRDRLTDRQLEILSAALHSGYFEWHRKTTGEELAEMFDVSPPTVYRHLRLALRELVEDSVNEAPPQ